MPLPQKRQGLERDSELSIRRQCELLGIARSSAYYHGAGVPPDRIALMHEIDKLYTEFPFYGSRRLCVELSRQGYQVSRKTVQRLMRCMGLVAVGPKPRLSVPAAQHAKFPYLLRGVAITHPDHVWSSDITYLPLRGGFGYLVAVMDWFSRHVLSWRLSNSLDSGFCVEALEEALAVAQPEIFNTDQGSQFTSREFLAPLQARGVRISMDGRGRALDNVWIERLWRSVKYEEVYLHEYSDLRDARQSLGRYFQFYGARRPHQALDYRTPSAVYCGEPCKNS